MARRIVGATSVEVANLLDLPTPDVRHLTQVGLEEDDWLRSRASIERTITSTDAVLLGYGVTQPLGRAGKHFREQVLWMLGVLQHRQMPVLMVGGRPRHPSRWQRWTSQSQPDLPFEEALAHELALVPIAAVVASLVRRGHHQ